MFNRPKAPSHGRRSAAPAKKEMTRAERQRDIARRAIESAQFAKLRKSASSATPAPRYAVDQVDLVAVPKVRRATNRRLLALANGMPCLLRVPEVCNRDPATTVACHSNWAEHGGKGGHRKSDDTYSVWGCYACHTWLDSGGAADSDAKQMRFMLAHADQVLMWRAIAGDTTRPEADRKAAKWALKQLNATPLSPEAEGLPSQPSF